MADLTPEQHCSNFDKLRGDRGSWDSYCQTIHDNFYIEADEINQSFDPQGELSFECLYDSTPLLVANVLPAGIANYMTPLSGHWIGFRHKDNVLNTKRAVRKWYKEAEEEVFYILANSNFYEQAMPFYKESSVYGTANILCEEDYKDVVRFYTLPMRQCWIVEDASRRVNQYYILFEYTVQQAVDKFGYNKLSQAMQEAFDTKQLNPSKRYEFVLYVGPRYDRNPNKTDSQSMPIQAKWIEVAEKKIVAESGYERMPCFTHRFYTRLGTPYGYSPAMCALSDARYLQVMAKTEMLSAQQKSLPAMAFPNGSFLQPLNLNPLAMNAYDPTKLAGKDGVFPLGGYGDIKTNELMLEKRIANMKEHLFYDSFLAFQNITKEMTVPEVMQRANERMTLLGPAVGRFMGVLNGAIGITLEKAFKAGKLPPLPGELIENPNYEIDFTSVLTLAQKSADMQALQTALAMAGQIAQFDPTVLHKIDTFRAIDAVWDITGADPTVRKDDEEAMKSIEAASQQQQQQEQMAMANEASQVAKNMSTAERNQAKAQTGG
jgi:hypothetical protein